MKKRTIALFALLLALAAPAAQGELARYYAPMTGTPPVIDGKLDDAIWQTAPARAGFTELGKSRYVDCQSFLQAAWDDKNLYVGLKAMEPLMGQLVVSGGGLWSDDSIEIFVALKNGYGQHAINTAGSQWGREAETQGWPAKVFKGANFYSVELAIPLASLAVKPEENAIVRANFDRNRRVLGKENWVPSCWSPNAKGFHEPENFGEIVLVKTLPADWPDRFVETLAKELERFNPHLMEMKRLCDAGQGMTLCKPKVEPFAKLVAGYKVIAEGQSLEDKIAARALIRELEAQFEEVRYAILTAELFE